MSKTLDRAVLAQFIGTECWYRHAINRAVFFTEGVKYVADQAGAYWLLDELALLQAYNRCVASERFQVWKLIVNPDASAELTCADGNYKVVYAKHIAFTDFPPEGITLWLVDDTILLPSEY